MPGQASVVTPPTRVQCQRKAEVCPLPSPGLTSCCAWPGAGGFEGEGHREKRSGSGHQEADCLDLCPCCVPFVPAEVPLPICHSRSESRHGTASPPILLPTICPPPSRPRGGILSPQGLCDFGQAAEPLWASVSFICKMGMKKETDLRE